MFPVVEFFQQVNLKYKYETEIFHLQDGGTCLIEWYLNPKVPSSQESLMVHGLDGLSFELKE